MVPQHGPFSFYTMVEDPSPHKMGNPTPMVWPLDDSQGPSPFHGHGPWVVCEVALSLLYPEEHDFLSSVVGFHNNTDHGMSQPSADSNLIRVFLH